MQLGFFLVQPRRMQQCDCTALNALYDFATNKIEQPNYHLDKIASLLRLITSKSLDLESYGNRGLEGHGVDPILNSTGYNVGCSEETHFCWTSR